MAIKRREVLVLVTVWVVGCAVVAGLLGIFYANSNAEVQEPVPPEPAAYTIDFADNTAKNAYFLSLEAAQQWREDVEMIAVSAQWPEATTVDRLGEAAAWDFRFFSPERKRIYFSTVTPELQVIGRAHLFEQKYRLSLINLTNWVLDSDDAMSIWVNNGGGTFIESFPGSRVEMLLRQPPGSADPVWDIIGVSGDQSQIFYLAINAADGQIINQ